MFSIGYLPACFSGEQRMQKRKILHIRLSMTGQRQQMFIFIRIISGLDSKPDPDACYRSRTHQCPQLSRYLQQYAVCFLSESEFSFPQTQMLSARTLPEIPSPETFSGSGQRSCPLNQRLGLDCFLERSARHEHSPAAAAVFKFLGQGSDDSSLPLEGRSSLSWVVLLLNAAFRCGPRESLGLCGEFP